MDWLDAPYQFFHPEPGVPFELQVVRFDVGLAQRPIDDPPGSVVKPTIRFHLPAPGPYGPLPYVDFTNRPLLVRVLAVYRDLIARPAAPDLRRRVEELERISDTEARPLPLRLTRRGRGIETTYAVDVLED